MGYFCLDNKLNSENSESSQPPLKFNRVVTLKDTWANTPVDNVEKKVKGGGGEGKEKGGGGGGRAPSHSPPIDRSTIEDVRKIEKTE